MKNIIAFLFLGVILTLSINAFAGRGWYVTIENASSYPVTISPAGYDEWDLNDFAQDQILDAGYSTKTYYTEQVSGKECIMGIDILSADGNKMHIEFASNATLNTAIHDFGDNIHEFWYDNFNCPNTAMGVREPMDVEYVKVPTFNLVGCKSGRPGTQYVTIVIQNTF